MNGNQRIVAVGLLTQSDVERLGRGFSRLYPVRDTPCFGDLIRAIDEADRALATDGSSSDSTENLPHR